MTITTVTHSGDRLAAFSAATLHTLHRRGTDGAWDALVAQCRVPRFDRDAQAAAAAGFPLPRRAGASQEAVSNSWGTDERYRLGMLDRRVGSGDRIGIGTAPGLSMTLTIAPGVLSLEVVDRVRREQSAARVRARGTAMADARATFLEPHTVTRTMFDRDTDDGNRLLRVIDMGEVVLAPGECEGVPSRTITEWSARSRSRMVKAFASVDWTHLAESGDPLAMVTLTYPRDWLAVAPNGKTVKRHLAAFRQRFRRAVGRRLDGAWKLEFQRARRVGGSIGHEAPHLHLLMPVPAMVQGVTFESWLSATWADIVARSAAVPVNYRLSTEYRDHLLAGTGVDFASTGRMSDPKRLGVYFLKHGTKAGDGKEYQHRVPRAWLVDDHGEVMPENGPGRFWGFWGLKPAVVALDLDPLDFITVKRALRRVAAARARSVAYSRARHEHSVRWCVQHTAGRSRVLASSRLVGGFVVVNDGTRLAADLARWVNLHRMQ